MSGPAGKNVHGGMNVLAETSDREVMNARPAVRIAATSRAVNALKAAPASAASGTAHRAHAPASASPLAALAATGLVATARGETGQQASHLAGVPAVTVLEEVVPVEAGPAGTAPGVTGQGEDQLVDQVAAQVVDAANRVADVSVMRPAP